MCSQSNLKQKLLTLPACHKTRSTIEQLRALKIATDGSNMQNGYTRARFDLECMKKLGIAKMTNICEISGSHGGEYYDSLVGLVPCRLAESF
jgi:hypothetical protein